jgi:hypothetical protein
MRFIVFTCLLLIVACNAPDQTSYRKHVNIDSLLQAQVNVLRQVPVTKVATIGDATYTTSGLVDWEKELSSFRQLNLMNRPMYSSSYQKTIAPDPNSNLMIVRWLADADVPLQPITMYYHPETKQLKRLTATFTDHDFYFQVERTFTLDFTLLGTVNKLESYSVTGRDDYWWSDTQQFHVRGVVQ